MPYRAPHKPHIWLIGFGMADFLPTILNNYADKADLKTLSPLFKKGEAAARDLIAAGEADVFIAAGANGAFLHEHLEAPVVQVRVSGFDILHALQKARQAADRVAIFSYGNIRPELEEVKALLNVTVEQVYYRNREDAAIRIRELATNGIRVVVGSGMVCELAKAAGMKAVYLYSGDAVSRALEDALDIARLTRLEQARQAWLDASMRSLEEAVVAVDDGGRIRSINPACARLIGISAPRAVGQPLMELAPAFSLDDVLRTAESQTDIILPHGGRLWLVNKNPIMEGETCTGAVLTAREADAIQRADRHLRARSRTGQFTARHNLDDIRGNSPHIRQMVTAARHYANVDATVLISGETGTGKELVAQGIHNASGRRDGPFVAINCAAMAESLLESELYGYEEGAFTGARKGGKSGLIEAAHTGTLFLDEIGDLPPALQAKLLRVIQEREVLRVGATEPTPVDIRIVAASHRDLRRETDAGRFRLDLYYRLHILTLRLPALRERQQDVPTLAEQFATAALRRLGAPDKTPVLLNQLLPALTGYAWPGNVRELENLVERAAVFIAALPSKDLNEAALATIAPELFEGGAAEPSLHDTGKRAEQKRLRAVLAECGGDRREAARRLGISRTTLWRRLGKE